MTPAAPQPQPLLRLLSHHHEELLRSGLTEETIKVWGAYSIEFDQKGVLVQLGFPHLDPPALALPVLPPDRDTPNLNDIILKPDRPRRDARGRAIKYETRPRSRNRIHAPLAIRHSLGDIRVPLVITEGFKKAEKAAQEGLCCIAIPGVWNWLERAGAESFPTGDFDLIPVGARLVLLSFDSDAAQNPHIRKAEGTLAGFLRGRGARVLMKRLPAGPNGEKVGLDDFLVARGQEDFWKLPAVPVEVEPNPSKPSWPDAIAPQAFHGLAGAVVRAIEPHSEADPAGLLLQFLVAFGNAVGTGPHFIVEDHKHRTNLFLVLVGATSKARKGSAWARIVRLLAQTDPHWEGEKIVSGLSSGEGLIWQVRDPILKQKAGAKGPDLLDDGVQDKRLLVLEAEFAGPLRVLDRQGNILSVVIRDAWDSGNLRTLTKNTPARATGALISLVGHTTRDELLRYLSATEQANGFANRFLFACVARSKCLPEGGQVNEGQLAPFVGELRTALEFGKSVGEMRRDEEARKIWAAVYPELSRGRPGLLGAITSRAEAQVLRLSMIFALLDRSSMIRGEHLKAALAVWDYADASAAYIFADLVGNPTADTLLEELSKAPHGLTRTEINGLFSRHRPAAEIEAALRILTEAGLARKTVVGTDGRAMERWVRL